MPAVVRIPAESNISTGAVNIWHWIVPNSSLLTEVQNAVTALGTFYSAIAGVLQAGTITIGARCVTVDQNPNLIVSPTVSNVATTGGGQSPLQCAVVLRLFSNVVGGSHRGRVYLGPLDTAAIQANGRLVSAADTTTINAAAATLMGTTTGGIQLAVWSRKNRVAQAVTGVGVTSLIGTQRRRLS
jgi:hypothetical protein